MNNLPMKRVVCPDCGAGGGSSYPCWCHDCHKRGIKVLMLPASNDFIQSNWTEYFNKLPKKLIKEYPHAGIKIT